ncbi:hypothetical protein ANN_21899 [Periplaneta americana]|uniref:Per a allergen n=1 Tax=Periplaneta americana TaxID=6978 RepID=A0ABQ8S6Y0_PERAM|nr:hypothetical protein ANN_21899 [Periplaneta americana]
MAGLCEGGNKPPGSLKASNYVGVLGLPSTQRYVDSLFRSNGNSFIAPTNISFKIWLVRSSFKKPLTELHPHICDIPMQLLYKVHAIEMEMIDG